LRQPKAEIRRKETKGEGRKDERGVQRGKGGWTKMGKVTPLS